MTTLPTSTLEILLASFKGNALKGNTLEGNSSKIQFHRQIYFKASLTALSHAMEDQVLAGVVDRPLMIATFQRERFYRQEAHRYRRIAQKTPQVYVLAAPETDFANQSGEYETIAFGPDDRLVQEWNLVIVGPRYASCLICQEREAARVFKQQMDQVRQFEGIWTFDRQVTCAAAELLLQQIVAYRPELAEKVELARTEWLAKDPNIVQQIEPEPFGERLVTYLQAGQYKLLKAYRSLEAKQQRERLVNLITTAIRQSLDPNEVFEVTVRELGQSLDACRCLMYTYRVGEAEVVIQHEFLGRAVPSLAGQTWPLRDNLLFQTIRHTCCPLYVADTASDHRIEQSPLLQHLIEQWQIGSWLLVPVLHQEELMGVVELHHGGRCADPWGQQDLDLVNSIADQIGIALIQARAYAHLEDLNQQLEALDRTRDNLTAIVGHELRTPLSTVQICLESLVTEPDMPENLRTVMLDTALKDAERLRELVQDFLILSRLESDRVEWNLEVLSLQECLDMALSTIRARQMREVLPSIEVNLPANLPFVKVDGDWLVEILAKLLDNACKFTPSDGTVTIEATRSPQADMLQVTIRDTGRGIEPDRLEAVFDRFYQEEGSLRRTVGGTGLGLAICRQIVNRFGGMIWAESEGRDRGTRFNFTIPIDTTRMATSTQTKR